MTDQRTIERQTAALLSEVAPSRAPDRLYADVLTTIGRTRQRTRWLAFLKESPMRTPSGVAVGSPTFRLVMISMLTLALILVGAAALATGASLLPKQAVLPAPYGVADNGTIAFHQDGDIWVADASGDDQRLLIGGASSDTFPMYSRDGARIVFERRVSGQPPQVMVANADGSDATAIADIPGERWSQDWSPDDQQILVVWAIDGTPAISILTADGSQPARTLDLGDIRPFEYAAWRPQEGGEIIFTAYDPQGQRALYAWPVNGSGLRQIGEASTGPNAFLSPTLSPDGSTVVYWEFIDGTEYGSYLFLRDLETGVQTALSLDPSYPGAGQIPRFAPDGLSLLFESGPHDASYESGQNIGQLVIAPIDGSVPARPLGPSYSGAQPWMVSPDGTKVFEDRGAAGGWMVDIATDSETRTADGLTAPTWQRLGR